MLKKTLKAVLFFVMIFSIVSRAHASAGSNDPANSQGVYSHYLKGAFYLENEDYKKALTELRQVKSADKDSIYLRLKIAGILVRLDKINDAEKELQEAKKIDPGNFDVSLALIFIYSYDHKDEALEQEYEAFLKNAAQAKPGDNKIDTYLAQFYYYKKRYKEALDVYNGIVDRNPDDTESLFWIGYIYEETGKRQDAVKVWQDILAINPDYAPALNSLGYVYAEDGVKLDSAKAMLEKALAIEPENGAYLDSLGLVYFKKKDYLKAKGYFKKALLYIKDPLIYEHLGDAFILLNDTGQALAAYQEGLSCFPGDKNLDKKIKQYGKEDKTIKK
jgi:tetratricopeptide (TPR) repeat protein